MKGTIVVDTKEVVWYRQEFCLEEEMTPEQFIQAVENGELESQYGEYMYETGGTLTPESNGGFATMEIYQDFCEDKNLIFKNGL